MADGTHDMARSLKAKGERQAERMAAWLAASLALDGEAQQRAIRKGGVWWIRSRERETLQQAILHAVQMPDGL